MAPQHPSPSPAQEPSMAPMSPATDLSWSWRGPFQRGLDFPGIHLSFSDHPPQDEESHVPQHAQHRWSKSHWGSGERATCQGWGGATVAGPKKQEGQGLAGGGGADPRTEGRLYLGQRLEAGGQAVTTGAELCLPVTHPSTAPCACPQLSNRPLNEAPRTLSASTQDLSPR